MLNEGPYAGHVAIIVKQSSPFPFLKLPPNIRAKVYGYLLREVRKDKDAVDVRIKQFKKTAYSPDYLGNKNNFAIMATCKEILAEAAPIAYAQPFRFPGTQVVTTFMLQTEMFRKYLVDIRSDSYHSNTGRSMFLLLRNCPSLKKLTFAHISSNEAPKTAIKNMHNDAGPFLKNVDRKDPAKGLEILQFERSAFHYRRKTEEGNKDVVQWDQVDFDEFMKGLRAQLRKNN